MCVDVFIDIPVPNNYEYTQYIIKPKSNRAAISTASEVAHNSRWNMTLKLRL